MSDANRVSVRLVEESTIGTTPATPVFQTIRTTGQPDLGFQPSGVRSEELRADRNVPDFIIVGGEAGGGVPGELSFRSKDTALESAFFARFQERLRRVNTVLASQITNVNAGSFDVTDEGDAPVTGDIIRTEGFDDSPNNGFFEVDAGATNTNIPVVGGGLTADASPAATARIHVVGRAAATSDIVATAGPNGLTSTVLDFTTLDLEPGDWIKIAGFTTDTDNNDWVRISTIAANILRFDIVPTGWGADSGSGDDVVLYLGERIKNGVERIPFTLEREFEDHSPATFEYLRGFVVDQFGFTATPQAVVTDNIAFVGLNNEFTTTRFAGAQTLPAPTTQVLNSSSNVGRLARGGAPIAGINLVLEASIQIQNGLRRKNAVGVFGAADIGTGDFDVTGTLNSYFDSAAIAQQVTAGTETSFDTRFVDADGHYSLWDVPRMKFTEGFPVVPGRNQDVVINPGFQAILHESFGYTLKHMRFHGVQ